MSDAEQKRLLMMAVIGAGAGMLTYIGAKVLSGAATRRSLEILQQQDAGELIGGGLGRLLG